MTDRTELLEAALDSLPDGIVLASQEGQVMFWNRAAEAITGHSGWWGSLSPRCWKRSSWAARGNGRARQIWMRIRVADRRFMCAIGWVMSCR